MTRSKKTKSGRATKKKQAAAPVKRHTGFINTEGGPERVLPPEIRKIIYRYLLIGRNVKYQRDNALWNSKGPADYYRFEVNILRANKTIHAEAREVLYQENTFAVLSTKEHQFCYRLKLHAVPVVSESFAAVDRFSEHCLYIRCEGPQRGSPGGEHLNCKCVYCRAPAPEKRRLLLSDDLPALLRICRVINHMDPDPTFFIVDKSRNDTFGYQRLCENRKPSSTLIEFRNNTYGKPTSQFVEHALSQLRKVAGDRRVEIRAPGHTRAAAECKRTMMPKVVWAYAIGWDLIEVARELKAAADEMIRNSTADNTARDKLAMKLYDEILLLLGNSMIFRRFGRAFTYSDRYCKHDTDDCFCVDWPESWTLLNLDLAIASMCLNLWSGSDSEADAHMVDVLKFMLRSHRVPDVTRAHANHLMAFVHVKKGLCRDALTCLKSAQTHREMAGLESDDGLEQDIAKQVKHMRVCNPAHGERGDSDCRFICCSSFAGKPCEAWDSPFDGVQPAEIFAWQDFGYELSEENLRSLGLTRKDVPRRLQRQPETPMDPVDHMAAMHLST